MLDRERQNSNNTELREELENLFNYLLELKKERGRLVGKGVDGAGKYSRYELVGYLNDFVIRQPADSSADFLLLVLNKESPYPIRSFQPEGVVVEITPSSIAEIVSRRNYSRNGIFSLHSPGDTEGKFPGWLSFPVSMPPDALIEKSKAPPSISLWGLYDENGEIGGISLSLSGDGDLRLDYPIGDSVGANSAGPSEKDLAVFRDCGISIILEPRIGVGRVFFNFELTGIRGPYRASCCIPSRINCEKVFSDLENLTTPFCPDFFFNKIRVVS